MHIMVVFHVLHGLNGEPRRNKEIEALYEKNRKICDAVGRYPVLH